MECSENEKNLACIDIEETMELLLDAEEGYRDLDACIDDRKEIEEEAQGLRKV